MVVELLTRSISSLVLFANETLLLASGENQSCSVKWTNQVFRVPDSYFMNEMPPARLAAITKKAAKDEPSKPKPRQIEASDDSDEDVLAPPTKTWKPPAKQEPKVESKTENKIDSKPKKKIVYVDDSDDDDWNKESDSDDN